MSSRMHQAVVASALTVATTAVIFLAGWLYESRSQSDWGVDTGATQAATSPATTAWPTPDPTAVAGLVTSLGAINPELRYGSPELKAMLVCRDIRRGDDAKRVVEKALEIFGGDGSFPLSHDDGQRIVAAVRKHVCIEN
ncbi:hypothetical protein [Kitasatospora sp. NPDC008115]|uniref:hypothetical protein n=1 Tax=Kitasatospora sp. NPDC008115 TaxID=3364022 RepID=UPI0036EAAA27